MYLTRLMYFSENDPEVKTDIQQILDVARETNEKFDVSGVLWFDGDIFIQVLEGQRKAVSEIYHRIAGDPRHHNIELVECVSVSERLFGNWTMGYLANTRANRAKIFQYSGHKELLPREMSTESMLSFLLSLDEED